MITITITNLKGGVGKTVTAQAIIEALKIKNKKVLSIDLDNQGNLSTALKMKNKNNAYDIIVNNKDIKEVIVEDNIPSFTGIFNEDVIQPNQLLRLKTELKKVDKDYDYCIIDTPPSLNKLTINALMASDYALIPLKADVNSINALIRTLEFIKQIKSSGNDDLKVLGALFTCYSDRKQASKIVYDKAKEITKQYGTKVFDITISEAIKIVEQQLKAEPLISISNFSKPSYQYQEFVQHEIIETLEGN